MESMSTQSTQNDPPAKSEAPRLPDERERERPTQRAFVVQFDRPEGGRARLRGRVELVASGEAIRFRSLKQLVGFMVRSLSRRTDADPS
jgi:hypothetical protein